MAKKGSIASVLSFEKKLVPSDGFMYGTTWEKRHDETTTQPLKLQEKSVAWHDLQPFKGNDTE